MKIKRIQTDNGNFLIANEEKTVFGYFDLEWNYLQQAFSVDWRRAVNSWGKPVEELTLKENPFPEKESGSSFGSMANAFGNLG